MKDYQVSFLHTVGTGRDAGEQIGLAVGKLRTHSVKDVSDLAKEIVKKWKHAVDEEK